METMWDERGRPDQIEWTGVVTWCKRVAPTEISPVFAQINRQNLPNKYRKETLGAHRRAPKTLANKKRSHNLEIDNQIKTALITAWGTILDICKDWIQTNLSEFAPYHWDKEWRKWQKCTWEIFGGQGDSIPTAMELFDYIDPEIELIVVELPKFTKTLDELDSIRIK